MPIPFQGADELFKELTLPADHWMRKLPDDHFMIQLSALGMKMSKEQKLPVEKRNEILQEEADKHIGEIGGLLRAVQERSRNLMRYKEEKKITPEQRKALYREQQDVTNEVIFWAEVVGLYKREDLDSVRDIGGSA